MFHNSAEKIDVTFLNNMVAKYGLSGILEQSKSS